MKGNILFSKELQITHREYLKILFCHQHCNDQYRQMSFGDHQLMDEKLSGERTFTPSFIKVSFITLQITKGKCTSPMKTFARFLTLVIKIRMIKNETYAT